MNIIPKKSFWKNKKVFLTGHTGFKGTWTYLWLDSLGAKIKGYSIDYGSNPEFFKNTIINYNAKEIRKDINDFISLKKDLKKFNPDIIIHMAAQPLVLKSLKEPLETHSTNILGTANLLEAAKEIKNIKSICVVTSDKCYENKNLKNKFTENSKLGGRDPYSASKACAEIITHSYYHSFYKSKKIAVFTVRAGNVIGGGDWAENRIFPDIIRAYLSKKTLIIRNPNHTRPWQHVLDPINAYIKLIEKSYIFKNSINGGWNVGPKLSKEKNVKWLVDHCSNKISFKTKINYSKKIDKESHFLSLNSKKINKKIGWKSKLSLEKSINLALDWYTNLDKKSSKKKCLEQIKNFNKL